VLPFALTLCCALLAPAALAAEPTSTPHTNELSPTVITAIAPSSPLTIVTNPKDPRQPVPASDGADYLKTIPGFALVRNGGTNGDPVLRGMFGSRLNILTNGGMMLGACPGRMDAPTSYISPETYDKLTVIKGPQTVLWGPGVGRHHAVRA
jgi:iron complex outermembrane receptor protein